MPLIYYKRTAIIIGIILHFSTFSFSQEWKGNRIGIDNKVPKPWTPLQLLLENNLYKIDCWGRTYTFDGISLLKQISALEEDLLSKELALVYDANSNWQPLSGKIVQQSGDQIQLEFISSLKNKKIQITNKTLVSIFYDGVIFYHVELSSSSKLKNSISIELSMKERLSTHIHRYASTSLQKQPWVSDKFPKYDNTRYIPYFWMGNSDKGLFWFVESPYNWINYKNTKAIVFSNNKTNGSNSATLNIVDSKGIDDTKWTFEFGLQGTPVRPIPNNWRSWQLAGLPESNIDLIWPRPNQPYALKHFGYPEAKDTSRFRKYVEDRRVKGNKVITYNCLTWISNNSPEWQKYKDRWDINSAPDMGGDVKAFGDRFYKVNFMDSLYQDFIVWKSNKLMEQTGINGFYLDNGMIRNINVGKKVRSFGNMTETIPYFPVMESRKLQERFYKMVKSQDKENIIIIHSSACIVTPILGFSDAVVDGEQYRRSYAKVKNDYLSQTTLNTFQSEFSGSQYGFPIIFLPVLDAAYYKTFGPTRYLAAILLQHDLLVWPQSSVYVVWSERYKLLSEFLGYETASFIPYYSHKPILSSNTENIIGSVYRNNRDEYLCIVSNLNNVDFSGDITFTDNSKILDDYKLIVKNGRNKSVITSSKSIRVDISKQDYAVFYLLKK